MKINLNTIKIYFLTVDTNGARKHHILEEFKGSDITEINPILNIGKNKSGTTGFSKMIDLALRQQKRYLPFQPFILFEDDCSKYREFPNELVIPDNTDILYIGLSKCGTHKDTTWAQQVYMTEIDNDLVRVYNMLASHAIMVCSASGALALQKAILESYFMGNPWDIFIAGIQPDYNVYALKNPLVYQDAAFGGAEEMTKFQLLDPIQNSELPPYHRIHCVSNLTCQGL